MDNLQDRRILVTGAAGFIGANLVRELLRRGAEVHALVRASTRLWRIAEIVPRLTLHLVDLTDREQLQRDVTEIRPDIVFNLAMPGGHPSQGREEEDFLKTSIMGTANLLEAMGSLNFQSFVHIGSFLEYGPKDKPMEELDILQPSSLRGVAKAATTLLCQQFARANRRPVVILRAFSVYGYWEAPSRFIPTTIMAALRNQEIAVTVPGYRRDLIFVEDLVAACLLALVAENVAGEIINVGSGQQWSNEEVVEMVQAVSGQMVRVRAGEYPTRPSDTTYSVADIRKAKRLLGWEPQHTLQSALEKTVSWFRQRPDVYDYFMRDNI